ncbi:MipA/OmpV family protein [Burkholderia anthina]|uniref:MipA/OmpV family protein n=1 Tax=Burkholderia anthina TaxID=179879 RepID=UPI001FC7E39F|nr:MipA/OmpV family protein [Burkholderia anthina]
MHTWFALTRSPAAHSRAELETYSPSPGFKSVARLGSSAHRIDTHWSVVTTLGVNILGRCPQ